MDDQEQKLGKELLMLAIEIEKNGQSLYSHLAEKHKDRNIKDSFRVLAEREREHEDSFRTMLAHIAEHSPRDIPKDEAKYLRDLADTTVTRNPAWPTVDVKARTDIEAIEMGISMEKDSIILYSDMRGMLPRPDQDIIDMIVSEEKKHLIELTLLLNGLRKFA